MTADRKPTAFRTALGGIALGFGLVGLAATAQAHDWKKPRYYHGPPGVVVVPAPAYYAPPVVAVPVAYAPAPVMYAPAYPAYAAPGGNLSIGLNVPLR